METEAQEEDREWRRRDRRKAVKRWLLVPFVDLALLVALLVLAVLPRRAMLALADTLSAFVYLFDRRGRRRSLENLHILRGRCRGLEGTWGFDPDHAEYRPTAAERKVIRRSYRSMTRTICYTLWAWRDSARRCRSMGFLDEAARAFLHANRPAVTVSAHVGFWEVLPQLAHLEGHRMMSVSKDFGLGFAARLLIRSRRAVGQEIVRSQGAFRLLMAGIREGKSLGLLVDQSVSPKLGGIWVRFCGCPIAVSAAPAFFAAKGKAPIVIAWARTLKDGRCRGELAEVIPAAAARDIWGTTQRIATVLEGIVRRHPSEWVMNYNFFSNWPKPDDLKTLSERESAAR